MSLEARAPEVSHDNGKRYKARTASAEHRAVGTHQTDSTAHNMSDGNFCSHLWRGDPHITSTAAIAHGHDRLGSST